MCAEAFEDLEAEDVGTRVGAVNEVLLTLTLTLTLL